MNKITDEQLDGLIKSAVNSSGPFPPDEKFSQIISALRELRDLRAAMLQGKAEQPQNSQQNIPGNIPDGYVLVPVEPTEAMMLHKSGCQHHAWDDQDCVMRQTRRLIWSHMIAAAPKQEV